MSTPDRILSLEQAARLIYKTSRPTEEQLEKVRAKLDRGVLQRSPRGRYTTTTSAVADYMAGYVATAKAQEHRGKHVVGKEPLPGLYRELLKDYFLAVLLQKTARRRSAAFGWSVLAMQVCLVLLPPVILVATYHESVQALIKSPERAAVEAYMEREFDSYEISKFQPLESSPGTIRVEFWYTKKGSKRIESVRLITVSGGQVTDVNMPE